MSGVRARIGPRVHAFRQLGLRDGTQTAVHRIVRAGRSRVRARVLARRPLRVTPPELAAALGGLDIGQALAASGRALPSVERWTQELPGLGPDDRRNLLRRADEVKAHRFDLLGSGPIELGPVIDWHRDFKTQRTWPLRHISRVPVSYPDDSDIKVPWELSRCQHLPLLAAAHVISDDARYLDEIGSQLTSWIAANPVEIGVNWACTMDVAIRGVNWVATLAICRDAASRAVWSQPVVESLLLHARFIRGHLESGLARGNHYLSDIVGLLVISALFQGSAEGRGWARWAVDQLAAEMGHQVRADGCDHEASIPYHRLVTELFIIGADAADVIMPGALDPCVHEGLGRMLGFVADYTRPDGLAPQIGDADDGRLLPLGDYAATDHRSHVHLFRQADAAYVAARVSAAYPDGGFYVLRADDLFAAVRCGDVGIYGRGCHSHNDLLAFELSCGNTALIVDPGSYLYTANPSARNHFRSTAAHSALQVDGAEQNEVRDDRLFAMVDRSHAEVLTWTASPTMTTLRGRHRGFEQLGVHYTRTLRLDGARRTLEIIDEVSGETSHQLRLRLPLAPCETRFDAGSVIARFPTVELRIDTDGLRATVEEGWLSPSYGVRHATPVIRLDGVSAPATHRSTVELTLVSREKPPPPPAGRPC